MSLGDDDRAENGVCIRADEVPLYLDKFTREFYHNYKNEFENDTEFFRDCLQIYIQAFIDDFNGVEMPFKFGTSKKKSNNKCFEKSRYNYFRCNFNLLY